MFINPLTIVLLFDLHMMQLKWTEMKTKREEKTDLMDRGGWATLTVPIEANSEAQKWVAHL